MFTYTISQATPFCNTKYDYFKNFLFANKGDGNGRIVNCNSTKTPLKLVLTKIEFFGKDKINILCRKMQKNDREIGRFCKR